MKVSWKHHTRNWGKNISKKPLQDIEKEELFRKTKKISSKYTISITFTILQITSSICFLGFYKDKNTKLHSFFVVPTIVETTMETSPTNKISFQLGQA